MIPILWPVAFLPGLDVWMLLGVNVSLLGPIYLKIHLILIMVQTMLLGWIEFTVRLLSYDHLRQQLVMQRATALRVLTYTRNILFENVPRQATWIDQGDRRLFQECCGQVRKLQEIVLIADTILAHPVVQMHKVRKKHLVEKVHLLAELGKVLGYLDAN